jgi:hypothetical protein
MGSDRHFAWQQSLGPNVRFGSKADIGARLAHVRFTPESGHWLSASGCPVISGHPPLLNVFAAVWFALALAMGGNVVVGFVVAYLS